MNWIVYWVGRAVIGFVQWFPLSWVARAGRAVGAAGWWVDRRHRTVALDNLTAAFGTEKSPAEIRAIARENYLRLAENYLSLLKIGGMSDAEIGRHMEWSGLERLQRPDGRVGVIVIGHFGNFELFGRLPSQLPDNHPPQTFVTSYRALQQPALNALLQDLRRRAGAHFFERRTEAELLKQALAGARTWLVLLADQHAGDRGVWLPLLGRECSCSASPAVFALRHRRPLITAICYRTGRVRWRLEIGEWISETENGRRRTIESITREINNRFESAIRRDPANWFWVHRRWKPSSGRQRISSPDAAFASESPSP
ncbi:MAG: lysophospholipid acyltransferase family protein [Verrucomicrobiae bacterium]|nr:lysophospholipid acyltransferase family protein [Verrucomicrobiae bacterium]